MPTTSSSSSSSRFKKHDSADSASLSNKSKSHFSSQLSSKALNSDQKEYPETSTTHSLDPVHVDGIVFSRLNSYSLNRSASRQPLAYNTQGATATIPIVNKSTSGIRTSQSAGLNSQRVAKIKDKNSNFIREDHCVSNSKTKNRKKKPQISQSGNNDSVATTTSSTRFDESIDSTLAAIVSTQLSISESRIVNESSVNVDISCSATVNQSNPDCVSSCPQYTWYSWLQCYAPFITESCRRQYASNLTRFQIDSVATLKDILTESTYSEYLSDKLEIRNAVWIHKLKTFLKNCDKTILDCTFEVSSLNENLIIPYLVEYRGSLESYIARGKILSHSIEARSVSDDITKTLLKVQTPGIPKQFYFVEASSGEGKSQLAHTINRPVVYLPMTTTQYIYRCFNSISESINSLLQRDLYSLGINAKALIRSNELSGSKVQFWSVGLLVALFECVYGKTNEESFKVLSGYNGNLALVYRAMTLLDARYEINRIQSTFVGDTPVFIIDEVPDSESDLFVSCILLRNLIRQLQCVCLLSGTEAAAMNTIDHCRRGGSRTDGNREYIRIIMKLPSTDLEIFESDTCFKTISYELRDMLSKTRPLFVEYCLKAIRSMMEEGDSTMVMDIVKVISEAKQMILDHKVKFCSEGGVYAQICLFHSGYLDESVNRLNESPNSYRRALTMEELNHAKSLENMVQYAMRHHFGKMVIPNVSDVGIVSLVWDDGFDRLHIGNIDKVSFVPNVVYSKPVNDPLLYLICFRNGVHLNNGITGYIGRVPVTHALRHIYKDMLSLPGNTNQKKCSGHFLEVEMSSAAISASHSCDSVQGCSFPDFISRFIAELNHIERYSVFGWHTAHPPPSDLQSVLVGLLSAANNRWDGADASSSPSLHYFGEVMASDFLWPPNRDQCDGKCAILINKANAMMSLEAKCYAERVSTDLVIDALVNMKSNKCQVGVMVVTDIVETKNQGKFKEASEGFRVAKIGSIKENDKVTLTWNWVKESEDASTLVIVNLDAIYPLRQKEMLTIYQSS